MFRSVKGEKRFPRIFLPFKWTSVRFMGELSHFQSARPRHSLHRTHQVVYYSNREHRYDLYYRDILEINKADVWETLIIHQQQGIEQNITIRWYWLHLSCINCQDHKIYQMKLSNGTKPVTILCSVSVHDLFIRRTALYLKYNLIAVL